jgi:hypothetical protein
MRELIERAIGLHERIAEDVPQIKRGMVWCTVCSWISPSANVHGG